MLPGSVHVRCQRAQLSSCGWRGVWTRQKHAAGRSDGEGPFRERCEHTWVPQARGIIGASRCDLDEHVVTVKDKRLPREVAPYLGPEPIAREPQPVDVQLRADANAVVCVVNERPDERTEKGSHCRPRCVAPAQGDSSDVLKRAQDGEDAPRHEALGLDGLGQGTGSVSDDAVELVGFSTGAGMRSGQIEGRKPPLDGQPEREGPQHLDVDAWHRLEFDTDAGREGLGRNAHRGATAG